MATIEPLHYGITYDIISKNVGKEVYDNGRYFISPFKSFIIYPANYITIEFSDNRRAAYVRKKI